MELINKCIDYLKANPVLAIVLIAAVALLLVVIVVMIAVSSAKRKKKKQLATIAQQKPVSVDKIAEDKAEEEKAKKEKAEAERQATLARLEAERIAAEKEEAEKAEKAEKAKKEKEEAEKLATEQPKKVEKVEKPVKAEKVEKIEKPKKPVVAEKKTTADDEIARAVAERSEKEHAQKIKREKEAAQKAKEKKKAAVQKALGDDENEAEKAAKYTGKWTICRVITDSAENDEEEMYFFELHASNGEKLLSSEEYTSYAGALRGIQTHKANIEKGNFKITLSKKGDYIFKLLSGKNMLLCMGENYPTRVRCENAIESTKRFAKTAVIDENVQDHLVKVPVEDDVDITPVADNYNGKWLITSHSGADGEPVFYFELFANNGEKLLSSEEYTTYIGAVNGIATHKSNIEKGNFRISLTKRGDYIYKLLNGNGQLLCLGEHYKTKGRCQSAVESVKRFAMNSPVLTDPALK